MSAKISKFLGMAATEEVFNIRTCLAKSDRISWAIPTEIPIKFLQTKIGCKMYTFKTIKTIFWKKNYLKKI